jgi:hypothetical protein
MNPVSDQEVAVRCEALSNPDRVKIIRLLLAKGEMFIEDIQKETGFTQLMTNRHLFFLKRCELVFVRIDEHRRFYRVRQSKRSWLKSCCC